MKVAWILSVAAVIFAGWLVVPVRATGTVQFSVPTAHQNKTDKYVLGDTTTSQDTSNYSLPYPGILPDNPLYIFKQLRDAIMDMLIVDPYKHLEFYILQSDKRLSLGLGLLAAGNKELAVKQFTESEAFIEKVLNTLLNRKVQGLAVPGYLIDEADDSLYKHIQVYTDVAARLSPPESDAVSDLLSKVQSTNQDLSKLR